MTMICPFCSSNSVEPIKPEPTHWQCQNCGRWVDPVLSPSFDILRLSHSELLGKLEEGASNDEADWDLVRKHLQMIVDAEDKMKPWTDQELASQISLRSGIDVSTDAVRKYREMLDIPDAAERCDESTDA